MPPINEDGAISIIGKAVSRLEACPQPGHFEAGSNFRSALEYISSRFHFPMNLIASNFWLFGPVMKRLIVNANAGAAAMVRTTTAVCKIHGGTKLNVLPYDVRAYVNHRVHPLDTFESVLEHDRCVRRQVFTRDFVATYVVSLFIILTCLFCVLLIHLEK